MLFYGIELAAGTSAQNLTVEGSATLPSTNLHPGRLYFNTSLGLLELYNGTDWVTLTASGGSYNLPIASNTVLGGIKVGAGLSIDSNGILTSSGGGGGVAGVASFNGRTGTVVFTVGDLTAIWPIATTSSLGVVQVGSGLSITGGILSTTGGGGGGSDIPSGSRMLFAQASAPTGWTQDTSDSSDNRMIRAVTSGGGGITGTSDPSIMNVVPSHTHTISATTDAQGNHIHGGVPQPTGIYMVAGGIYAITGVLGSGGTTAAGVHAHNVSGTVSANAGASNWSPRILNMIVCVRN